MISPDIKNISATDTTKRRDLIKLGEVATQSQIAKLREFPKNSSNNKRINIQKEKRDSFVINKIEYDPKFDKNTIDILNNIFIEIQGD